MNQIKANLIKSYNGDAKRRAEGEEQDWKKEVKEDFKNLLFEEGKKNLLELGAGTGDDSFYFTQHHFQVVSIDLSEEMVKYCLEKGLNAKVMDFYHLDFEGESFDAAYAMNSLLHVPKADLGVVLSEIKRVLKPQGLLFMGVYGGRNSEGNYEDDWCEPKRFFSFYKDEDVKRVVGEFFQIESFKSIPLTKGELSFQAMVLRKK